MPASAERSAGVAALKARLVAVVESARQVSVVEYEQAAPERLESELVPRVSGLALDAIELLDLVLDLYERDAPDGDPIERDEPAEDSDFFLLIDRLMADRSAAERIADLAFMARAELRRKLDTLSGLGAEVCPWNVIACCGSCLRKLRKALSAVEAALCEHEGGEPALAFTEELAGSLEVRRVYAKFRREIFESSEAGSVTESLHRGATSIAKLIGRDVYGDLRIGDRVQLRSLQERILAWQREGPERDLREGLRLWQDLCGFAHLLAEVSKRQELLEHDRAVVARVGQHLAQAPHGVLPEGTLPLLEPLFGRDDELDALLVRRGPVPVSEAESILRRLTAGLFPNPHEAMAGPAETPYPDMALIIKETA